jgi:phosphatidylglycerol:prolipoprotein diacylglycerol transferase
VLVVVGVLWHRRISLRLTLDILVPSVALGLGFGRLGCLMHGCCWGAACSAALPWGVTFPAESPPTARHWQSRLISAPAEAIEIATDPGPWYGRAGLELDLPRARTALAEAGGLRSAAVHPTQIYASIGAFVLAGVLNQYFFRRKRHGMVFGLFLVLYPMMRFLEESIRGDNPLDTFHLTISQFISIVLALAGLAYMIALQKLPVRSPRSEGMRLAPATVPAGRKLRAAPKPRR